METKIRRAEKNDCAAMFELIKELAVYEKAPNEVTVSMEHFVQSGFGENPVWWAFVAEVENKIVGMSLYYIRYSTWKGQCLYLEDIIVTEKYRGLGIGKKLFDATLEEAKEKKFANIAWQVLNWNTPAIDFYKKYNCTLDDEWINAKIGL